MEQLTIKTIIHQVWAEKNLFISAVLIAAITSAIIVLLQPNYYKAETVFYPVHSSLLEPALRNNDQDIHYYGDDHDVDRLLSIANSYEVAQRLIDEFNLAAHYGIDIDTKNATLKLNKRFKKRFNIQKTEFDALELSIEDQDPEIAQQLVSAMRNIIDEKAIEVIHNTQNQLLANIKNSVAQNRSQIKIVSDSLTFLRKTYGIYDTQTQSEALASLEAKSPQNRQVRKQIDGFQSGVSAVKKLESLEELLNDETNVLALNIQVLETFLASEKSTIHLIEEATIPLEKSRPKRTLIVLATALTAALTMLLLILIRNHLSGLEKYE